MDTPAPFPALFRGDSPATQAIPVRGVSWVLRWAGILAALILGFLVLTAFTVELMTEQALIRAADAGLREARMPRATTRSIEAVVRRRLAITNGLDRATSVMIGADSIALSVPVSAVLPRWMSFLGRDGATIECERASLPTPRTRKLRTP
jgi:hypothetical protein